MHEGSVHLRVGSGETSLLYFEKIEDNAVNDDSSSELGLISMLMDYNAKIQFKIEPKFEQIEPLYDIYIKVILNTDDINNFN